MVASEEQEDSIQKEESIPEGKAVDKKATAPEPPKRTRGGFRKGALLAMLLMIPGLSKLLSHLALVPLATSMAFDEIFATVAVFAGLPALFVFGGIGKNLARQANRSRKSLLIRGALLGGLAGISLTLLAAIPTATLPYSIRSAVISIIWAAALGAFTGALLGLWIDHARRRETRACAANEA